MLWRRRAQDESALDMAGMLAESGLRSSMRLWLRGWPIDEPSLPSVWLRRQLQAAILSAGRLGMPLPLELWWQVAHFLHGPRPTRHQLGASRVPGIGVTPTESGHDERLLLDIIYHALNSERGRENEEDWLQRHF
jgi:hypothetical protein